MSSRAAQAAHAATVAARAALYGIRAVPAPASTGKKYVAILPDGRRSYFGQRGASDFLYHRDENRRASYRARAEGQRLRDGRRAIDVWGSPAWLSYWLLW